MALSKRVINRLTVLIVFGAAFVVMASVFSPAWIRAGSLPQDSRSDAPPSGDSTDAHQGLPSLGAIESAGFIVRIYSTGSGPRYTVYDRESRREVGTLLTLDQVNQFFPEVRLKGVDFSAPGNGSDGATGPLMLADPKDIGITP